MSLADIDECISNPCGIHGSCENLEDVFQCFCDNGYTGEQCQGILL